MYRGSYNSSRGSGYRQSSGTPVLYTLIGINVVVFIFAYYLMPYSGLRGQLALIPLRILSGSGYWGFLTYMFDHANLTHILFNMLALFVFGHYVELKLGSREFLFFYMLSGILVGIFSFFFFLFTGLANVSLLGASGAIFAVVFAYAVFVPNSTIYIWGIIPVKASILIIGYVALELFLGITRTSDGVAHSAHLAGVVVAYFYLLIRFHINGIKVLIDSIRGRHY